MNVIERKKRKLDEVQGKAKWHQIITKFLLHKEMTVKNSSTLEGVFVKNVSQDGSKILVRCGEFSDIKKGDKLLLFKVLARYIQMNCVVLDKREGNQLILSVDKMEIAQKDRSEDRMQPAPGMVWITNVRTSKTTIDANLFNIPASVKVNFADYESKLRSRLDYIKVDVFNTIDDKFGLVRRTQKALFIEDTQNPESYKALNEEFLDYAEELGDNLRTEMNRYRDQKIVSEIIVPVLYLNPSEETIPIGYVHVQGRSAPLGLDKVLELKTLTFEMMDRIRESNTTINTGRFDVLDISGNGLKIKIDDHELADALSKYPGFSFDIFFKMQSPMTAYGLIRSLSRDADNNLYLGVMLEGHSARPGEKERFIANLNWLKNNPHG